jgi:hypothetical protein
MTLRWWIGSIAAFLLAACTGGTDPQLAGNVSVSVATQAPPALAPSMAHLSRAAALDDTIISGADTIIITSAELVLREIELKRSDVAACNGDDDCEEVEFGPVLVDLPLEPGAERKFAVELPAGSYDEIEFDVHKPDDGDPQDQAFLQQHPDFADISIRVRGTYIQGSSGSPFEFTSALNVEQELELDPPLVVDEATVTNVTIFVDLDAWFRRPDGTLVDPADDQNRSLIENSIADSMRAFEDRDEDGDDRDG